MDMKFLTVQKLLVLGTEANEELERRGIIRTKNAPISDFAEFLFCQAFGWKLVDNAAEKGVDAIGPDNVRYQVKARRLGGNSGDRQLGALRQLKQKSFDKLAAVLFDAQFGIFRAAIIPHSLVLENSRYQEHTNSSRFVLRDQVWSWPGVEDVTEALRTALTKLHNKAS